GPGHLLLVLVRGERGFFRLRGRGGTARRDAAAGDDRPAPGWYDILVRLADAGLGDLDRLGRLAQRQPAGLHAAAQRMAAARRADAIDDLSAAIAASLGDKEAQKLAQKLRRVK